MPFPSRCIGCLGNLRWKSSISGLVLVIESLHIHHGGNPFAPLVVHGGGDGAARVEPPRQALHAGDDARAALGALLRFFVAQRPDNHAGMIAVAADHPLELAQGLPDSMTSSASRPSPACPARRRRPATPAWADCARCDSRSTPSLSAARCGNTECGPAGPSPRRRGPGDCRCP